MDTKNKILSILTVCGIVMCVTGTNYIPQNEGPIPQGMSLDEFNRGQREIAINSMGFKFTMGGLGLTACSILIIYLRICMRKDEIPVEIRRLVPILKVRRVAPIIEASAVEASAVEASATQASAVAIPDTSINIMELRRTFKYPPPYDVMNP